MKRSLLIPALILALATLGCNLPLQSAGSERPTATVSPAPPTATLPEVTLTSPPTQPPTLAPDLQPGWTLYRNDRDGFEFGYPAGTLAPPTAQEDGSTRIDLPFAPDTNLLEKYVQFYVLSADSCSSPLLIGLNSSAQTVTIGNLTWTQETYSGVGLGNLYEYVAYSSTNGTMCVSLAFILHSANVGNYPTPPAEFDRTAESQAFMDIMSTFRWLP